MHNLRFFGAHMLKVSSYVPKLTSSTTNTNDNDRTTVHVGTSLNTVNGGNESAKPDCCARRMHSSGQTPDRAPKYDGRRRSHRATRYKPTASVLFTRYAAGTTEKRSRSTHRDQPPRPCRVGRRQRRMPEPRRRACFARAVCTMSVRGRIDSAQLRARKSIYPAAAAWPRNAGCSYNCQVIGPPARLLVHRVAGCSLQACRRSPPAYRIANGRCGFARGDSAANRLFARLTNYRSRQYFDGILS